MPKESLVPPEGPKLFVEGEKDDDDDDVEVVTETEPVFGGTMSSNAGAEGQGALVKDILDAQKQLAQVLGGSFGLDCHGGLCVDQAPNFAPGFQLETKLPRDWVWMRCDRR